MKVPVLLKSLSQAVIISAAVACLFVALSSSCVAHEPESIDIQGGDGPYPWGFPWGFGAIHSQRIVLDFAKLDFTLPNEPGFGKNPEWEVYNSKSRYHAFIDFNEMREKVFTDRSKMISVWYRFPQSDLNQIEFTDVLYMVITDVQKQICNEAVGHSTLSQNPIITPNTQGPVIQERNGEFYDQCRLAPNGVWYLYTKIATRYKPKGSEKWQ